LFAVMASLCSFSCTKKGNTGATGQAGPAGPAFKGTITGFVSVYDQYGSKLFNGLKNIQVSLAGRTTLTDSIGHYTFDSISTGTYALTATGQGLAATMVNNVAFIKDTLHTDIKMSALPTFNIDTFHAYHNAGSLYDSLIITVEPDSRPRNLIILVNNNRLVSNSPANYLLSYIRPIPVTPLSPQKILFRISYTDLNYANIFYGEEVYYAVYSYVVNDASTYEDMNTSRAVINAVGTPLIDSAMAP